MGWSQGGYISAFLAARRRGALQGDFGRRRHLDWMTYYVNTDIHPFTRQYLKATPWDDPEIYAKTSPITYIKQAKTPTLIQHGATDQRVPLPNAFELYQGLQDNNVPTKLIVYQGFGGIGHGPSKPKSHRATMEHNLEWFDQYLFQTPQTDDGTTGSAERHAVRASTSTAAAIGRRLTCTVRRFCVRRRCCSRASARDAAVTAQTRTRRRCDRRHSRARTILTATKGTIQNGTIVLRGGKIAAVGANVPIPAGAEVVDGAGRSSRPASSTAIRTSPPTRSTKAARRSAR